MEIKPNNVYNCDCYQAIKFMEDKSIDCVYTDIPYLYDKGGGGYSELSKRIKNKINKELKDFVDGIDYSILEEYKRVLKKVNIFIWCSKKQVFDILKWCEQNNYNYEILVWCKTNPTPQTNNTFLPDLEYCIYIREEGVKLNDGYELKSKYFIDKANVFDKDLFDHPTIKPVKLVERHLLHATKEDDVVLDTFLGSGTTAVACKNTNRQYIGIEINETYYNNAVKRLNNETASGQLTFLTL